MGNEMGNNNTSEFREEEKAEAEGPEKSLLEGEDNEVEVNEVADFEENRSDGNEHEQKKQASNQKEEEGERGSNLNTTLLALDEPTLEKTTIIKSNQHELLDVKGESLVEDDNKSPEECKEALELSLNNTYHSADCGMALSEDTINMNQVVGTGRGIDKENDEEREKCSNVDIITQESEDPKSKKTSDFDADEVIDINRDTNKEDDGARKKSSNFNTITQVLEDPKSEKTSDFDADQVTDNEDDGERENSSNFHTITQALEDPKSEKVLGLDFDQDTEKEHGAEKEKCFNFDMITQASEDPKFEKSSYFDVGQIIDTDRDTEKEDDREREKSSNLDTITQVLEDPKSEKTLDFDVDQVIDTDRDTDKEDVGVREKCSNFDSITQVLEDTKSEKTSNFDVDQVIDIDRDADKEHDADRWKGLSEDPKSEKTSDQKSIQHEFPETRVESLVGSSGDESLQEKVDTNMEKKKGDLIEPMSSNEYTMPKAKNVDTKDEETATNLICHNSSCSPPEESLVIESPKSAMQVPKVEDKCTNLKEESRLREEHLETDTVVQDNIPTQSKISNGVQEELNTIESQFKNNVEEIEVSSESVAKNKKQNEDPGEDSEDSNGEYLEICEQGMAILTLSIGDCKHKNEEIGETTEISTNNGHEAETREPEESLFEPVLGFQSQIHQKETSITFQNVDSIDESFSAPRQETKTTIEKSKKIPSDSPRYIQTASTTFIETKPSTNPIEKKSVTKLPFEEEGQESPGRKSNESNSDNSIGHIEMRKSPSFNIDIQSDGRAEETEKIPLLYLMKTVEDIPNLHEISFPNPMEKRVVKMGRSDSVKSKASYPGFAKEKEESEMKFKAIDQNSLAVAKNEAKELPSPSPIRKGKRRTKSLIFGTCICCATAIN